MTKISGVLKTVKKMAQFRTISDQPDEYVLVRLAACVVLMKRDLNGATLASNLHRAHWIAASAAILSSRLRMEDGTYVCSTCRQLFRIEELGL